VIVGRLDGRIVLTPIDLECVFRKYPLISSTLLLPKRDAHPLHCGLAEFVKLNALDLAVHASVSFVESMRRLQAGAARLGQVISKECEKATLYSRVVLRPTPFYSSGLQAGEKGADTDLLPSELEQLNRGDIPYYFRDISSDELRYFTAPGKTSPWDDVRERYSHVRHSLRIVSPDDPASVGCVDDRSVQASCLEILHKLGGSGRESFSERVGDFAIHKTSKLYRMESGEFEARGFYRT
jgi:hypothetical protein